MRKKTAFPAILALIIACTALRADTIEMLNGTKITGRITGDTETSILIEVTEGGAAMKIPVPRKNIHAVTINGKRKIINPKKASHTEKQPEPAETASRPAETSVKKELGKKDLDRLIQSQGSTDPDWLAATKMQHPAQLELKWNSSIKGWKPNEKLGTYIWVNQGQPAKWKSCVKLLYHVLDINKSEQEQTMKSIGYFYGVLLEDYARGAYWLRKGNGDPVLLARCYWKLGALSEAEKELSKTDSQIQRTAGNIKLWAEMGNLEKALKIAENYRNSYADAGYLAAGNACRFHGQYDKAIEYYNKSINASAKGRDKKQNEWRARACIDAVNILKQIEGKPYTDGTHSDKARGYRGDVTVEVKVEGGKISSVQVKNFREDRIACVPTYVTGKITEQNGIQGVDCISSATISSEAVINATVKALGK